MFEAPDGMEVFVNPERVMWVREYPNHTTVISCGHEDKFTVRLAPAHAVAAWATRFAKTGDYLPRARIEE
jgi:hypothetical protein